mgnify:CR=1 FL=1
MSIKPGDLVEVEWGYWDKKLVVTRIFDSGRLIECLDTLSGTILTAEPRHVKKVEVG